MVSFYLVCEATGTAATPGLLCQPRVIVKMTVEKQMECRLAVEIEVLRENLPQRHFCPSQNPTWTDPGLNPGRHCGKLATNRLSYGAAREGVLCILMPPGIALLVGPRLFIQYIQTGPPQQMGSLVRHPRAAPSRGYRFRQGIYKHVSYFLC
jgi:hypothetical protein